MRASEEGNLKSAILEIHRQSRGTYGSLRIHHELNKARPQEQAVNRKRVEKIMGEEGIRGRNKRRTRTRTRTSFFSTFKIEMLYRNDFKTKQEARTAIAEWIGVFYNHQRHHSTIGYATPVGFEESYYASQLAEVA